jgi:hypothetical protein
MPGRPIPSVSAPLRCADYRTEATKLEATGTQAAERTERAPFWLTYDSALPDGGRVNRAASPTAQIATRTASAETQRGCQELAAWVEHPGPCVGPALPPRG